MAPKTAPKVENKKTYKEMITLAITTLKDRNGSSRQAIKKYISSSFPTGPNFDSQFNMALSRGVKAGDFIQPKGSSGPVKLAKKEKKPAAPKKKASTTKKPATKKATTTKKAPAKKVTKKTVAAPKKKTVKKPATKAKK